jgi:hypothetical protein
MAHGALAQDYGPTAQVRSTVPDQAARSAQTSKRAKIDALLARARDQFRLSADADSANRAEMLEDERFRASDMWPADILRDRLAEGRPCLTIDRISGPIRQMTGEERKARPTIQISPRGSGADRETADLLEGIARTIQNDSHAEVAYDWAYEKAVSIGLGWIRLYTEYESDDSFDQAIKIGWVENPFCVYTDPAAATWDKRDGRFAFVKAWIPTDTFERKYGTEKLHALQDFSSTGDADPNWYSETEGCAVAEWFYEEFVPGEIAQLPDGRVIDAAQLDAATRASLPPKAIRTIQRRRILWCKISGTDILEGNVELDGGRVWAGKWIPLAPVYGEVLNIDGKRITRGIVRTARDPQRMFNIWESAATEMIALAPKAPFIIAAGQVGKWKDRWDTANSKNWSYLPYEPVDSVDGHVLPMPQRNAVEPPIQAIMVGLKQADIDIRAVTGFYDATDPGATNADQSGKAILARTQQGSITNVGFLDNLQRSLTFIGEMIVDLAPHVYDRPGRIVQVLGMDDTSSLVQLGPAPPPPMMSAMADKVRGFASRVGTMMSGAPAPTPAPTPKIVTLQAGRYATVVTVGSAPATKRQETVSTLLELFKAFPPAAVAGMDILIDNMDAPGMKQLAERLRKALPPQFQDAQDGEMPIPPQAQAEIAKGQQLVQLLGGQLQQANELLKNKKMELVSRERIAMMTTQASVAVAMAKLGSDADRAILDREFQRFTQQVDLMHDRMLSEAEGTQDAVMAGADAAHQRTMAADSAQTDATAAGAAAQTDTAAADADRTHARSMASDTQAHQRGMASDQARYAAQAAEAAAEQAPPKGAGA